MKRSHYSRPRNPIIADVAFKVGYFDTCKEAELPEPEMQEFEGRFNITLFKNVFTEEQIKKLGLAPGRLKLFCLLKRKGKSPTKIINH